MTRWTDAILRLASEDGLTLTDDQLRRHGDYLSLLTTWNRTVNLTSLPLTEGSAEAVRRLIIEPLKVAHIVEGSGRWLDLGSGGGSPAIPLRITWPQARLSMVESRGRKAAFLREAVRTCGLGDSDVLDCRIEELDRVVPEGSVDYFTVRALRLAPSIASVIKRLASASGQVILLGSADWSELTPEFERSEVVPLEMPDMTLLRKPRQA